MRKYTAEEKTLKIEMRTAQQIIWMDSTFLEAGSGLVSC